MANKKECPLNFRSYAQKKYTPTVQVSLMTQNKMMCVCIVQGGVRFNRTRKKFASLFIDATGHTKKNRTFFLDG